MGKYIYLSPDFIITKYTLMEKEFYFLKIQETERGKRKPRVSTYKINEIAAEILLKFDGTMVYSEIIKYFSEKYQEDLKKVNNKVKILLDQLSEKCGLILQMQDTPQQRNVSNEKFKNFFPSIVSLELTNKCNLKCKHCYGDCSIEKTKEIPKERLNTLFKDLKDIGVMTVELTGGDPTVYQYTSEAIEYAFKAGIQTVILLTNGVNIPNKLKETLKKYRNNMYLQVDLHSLDETYFDWFTGSKGNLDSVKKNIQMLIKEGIPIRVVSIATPLNYKEIERIADWSYEKGAAFYATSIVTALGRAEKEEDSDKLLFYNPDEFKTFLDTSLLIDKKYPGFVRKNENEDFETSCGALFSQVSINPDGDLKLCTMDTGKYFDFKMGNVFKNKIKDIYNDRKEFLYVFMSMELPDSDKICKGCEHALFCNRCFLRGLIQAKNIGNECVWFRKYRNTIIDQTFNIT